jgi:hypothetical protein
MNLSLELMTKPVEIEISSINWKMSLRICFSWETISSFGKLGSTEYSFSTILNYLMCRWKSVGQILSIPNDILIRFLNLHNDLTEKDVDKFEKVIKEVNEKYISTTIQNMVSNYCLCTAHTHHKVVCFLFNCIGIFFERKTWSKHRISQSWETHFIIQLEWSCQCDLSKSLRN